MRGLNRDQIVKMARLTGCKNFVGRRKKFIFNAFVDLKPVDILRMGVIFEDLGPLTTAQARIVDLLEPVKLIVWKVMIQIVIAIGFRMDDGGGNGAGCFDVEIWADTAKFTNVIVAGFRKCKDLV